MILTDPCFRLRPTGLCLLRQTVTTLQPVDELKKGPFSLQASVLGYQQVKEGVEVEVCLSAGSQRAGPVWQSVLTLLSRQQLDVRQADTHCRKALIAGQDQHLPPKGVVLVELSVPLGVWFWSKFDVLGCSSAAEWMLSVCLAEMEKHKGVGVVSAPVSLSAQFEDNLVLSPSTVTLQFWEEGSSCLTFIMQHPGGQDHMTGQITITDV